MAHLYTVLMTLLTLGILVTVHEWGHFFVARRNGVKVLRFSIGFGRPLLTWHDRHGTEFAIAWLPLGGYVKMLDEREAPVVDSESAQSFNRQPVSRRMAIAAAGPAANLLLAVLVLWLVYLGGVRGLAPVIGEVLPGSPAYHAGLEAGQEIVAIDGVATPTWTQVDWQLLRRIGDSGPLQVAVRYPDSDLVYHSTATISQWLAGADTPMPREAFGLRLQVPPLPSVIGSVVGGSPAAEAGFRVNDRVLSADGHDMRQWGDWVAYVRERPGQPLAVVVERDGALLTLPLTPVGVAGEGGAWHGQVGLGVRTEWPPEWVREYRYGLLSAWRPALADTWRYSSLTLDALRKMVSGLLSPRHLSGPVTIAKVTGSSARAGWQAYLEFLALLSISLAIINLLPIPVLDGGHLLLYGLEAILGRPVPQRIQQWAFQIGILLIIGLTLLALFNDFSRL